MLTSRERQADISALATKVGHVLVSELAEQFRVTPETIRRDLKILEQGGVVHRVHGGAVAQVSSIQEPGIAHKPFGLNPAQNSEMKRLIARSALTLLPEGNLALFVDSGSTTAEFVRELVASHPRGLTTFTIVTPSIAIASLCSDLGVQRVHVVTGQLRPFTKVLVGDHTAEQLRELRADIAVLGANGISATHGISTPDPAEAAIKAAMIDGARSTIVLCDSSKINKDCLVTFGSLDRISAFVTDGNADAEFLHVLRNHNVKVIQTS
ncbi:DeoR/GlpR family DNA-binding transcription regulator [Staphylococcus chromogenes]|nr:DeoR/GlpR family DNA-binding transcription regulator [Staphylococcus chromogenes]